MMPISLKDTGIGTNTTSVRGRQVWPPIIASEYVFPLPQTDMFSTSFSATNH